MLFTRYKARAITKKIMYIILPIFFLENKDNPRISKIYIRVKALGVNLNKPKKSALYLVNKSIKMKGRISNKI